jgi:hypothetical protein
MPAKDFKTVRLTMNRVGVLISIKSKLRTNAVIDVCQHISFLESTLTNKQSSSVAW